jgi:D-alanyl-D-alanine carboxypeptidase/D-alanyl-D-alanine-endopeptidase (penicillin-binding protein 4)
MENDFALCRFRLRFPTFYLLTVLCVFASLRETKAQSLPPATQRQINAVLDAPNLKEAHIGLSILDLGTVKDARTFPAKPYLGKPYRVLFERDANKCFMPASNMKLFTAAIALQLLGKEKTFPTRVYKTLWTANQFLLYGGGDPSLQVSDVEDLARQVVAQVPKCYAEVGGQSPYTAETNGSRYPFGWTMDDAQWYYGPEISGLSIERNQVDIVVTCKSVIADNSSSLIDVKIDSPLESLFYIDQTIKYPYRSPTFTCKSDDGLVRWSWVDGRYLQPGIYEPENYRIQSLWINAFGLTSNVTLGISIPLPPYIAAAALSQALNKHGFKTHATTSSMHYGWRYSAQGKLELDTEPLATHNSPPLKALFQRFLKKSDNLYAEMLLRDAAYYYDGTGGDKAGPHAHELLKKWLIGQGIDVSTLRFEDGSGLSRYNLLTPRATAQLLAAINSMKDGEVIWNALPIGGVDGTMKNRVKGTPAQNNARAKSGTFSIASNLSGYVTTRDHHRLAVSLYMNFARDGDAARRAQDRIYAILADTRCGEKP